MSARRLAWLLPLVGLACAGNGGPTPEAPVSNTARLQVAMWSGFEANTTPLPAQRTAIVVDASSAMSRRTEGVSHIRAGRLAAQRFVEALPATDPLDVFVVGGESRSTCDVPVTAAMSDERPEIARQLGRLRARGKGSVTDTLLALADAAKPLDRVVVVTNLFEECGGDLCEAAAALADRGAQLDLVAIGDVVAPECLGAMREASVDGNPVPWTSERPRRFHIQTTGSDAAILNWGLVNDIPAEVRTGELEVVVDLVPPLRVTRNFKPGSRWMLEVLDFPSLDPPERQWRWLPIVDASPRPPRAGEPE